MEKVSKGWRVTSLKADSHIRDFCLEIYNDVEIAAIGCMQPIPARENAR